MSIGRRNILIQRVIYLVAIILLSFYSGFLANFLSNLNNNLHDRQDFVLDTVTDGDYTIRRSVRNQEKLRETVSSLPRCDGIPSGLTGRVSVGSSDPPDLRITELVNDEVKRGSFFPKKCRSQYRVAIIIPIRGRERELRHLLSHMHPIWQRQEISYTVFTITQSGMLTFNKAKVMNAGFLEAAAYGGYDCYVFHDVDALLEDDRCLYSCNNENPRHLCAHADVFDYQDVWYFPACRPSEALFSKIKLFGGVTMFTEEQFIGVNGFSNYYWGWGGEDDDMYNRIRNKGYQAVNPYGRHCSYTLLQHPKESSNAPTRAKESLVFHSKSRQNMEGLNTLRYRVLSYEYNPLFINITVDVGRPSPRMEEFIERSKGFWFFNQCIPRMPWNL